MVTLTLRVKIITPTPHTILPTIPLPMPSCILTKHPHNTSCSADGFISLFDPTLKFIPQDARVGSLPAAALASGDGLAETTGAKRSNWCQIHVYRYFAIVLLNPRTDNEGLFSGICHWRPPNLIKGVCSVFHNPGTFIKICNTAMSRGITAAAAWRGQWCL
jgi:hypothetical protein